MKRLARGFLLPAALLVLTSCAAGIPVGSLTLSSSGLPGGVTGSAVLTGPFGYSEVIETGDTVPGLRLGTYTISPVSVTVQNDDFVGVERFDAPPQDVEVQEDENTSATSSYAYSGLTIGDADDDATGSSVTFPIFELTEVSSVVAGGVLELTVTFTEEQDDLSTLFLVMDLDTDQDSTTGDAFRGNTNCLGGPVTGSEYYVRSLAGTDGQIIDHASDTQVGTATRTTSGSSVTFAVDLADIGGDDGRMDVGLIVGNEDEPTDCLPPLGLATGA